MPATSEIVRLMSISGLVPNPSGSVLTMKIGLRPVGNSPRADQNVMTNLEHRLLPLTQFSKLRIGDYYRCSSELTTILRRTKIGGPRRGSSVLVHLRVD